MASSFYPTAYPQPAGQPAPAMPKPDALPTNPDVGYYGNALKGLLSNPNSFQVDPGYNFARDQALQATMRANSNMLGSGNLMTALEDRASGLASQAYDNRVNQLSGILGQQQQFQLGQGQNAIGAQNSANNFALGAGQNANQGQSIADQYALGAGNLGLGAQRNANDFALGSQRNTNDLTLGLGQNANSAQRNLFDYNLGAQSNANQAYGLQTNRASAESNANLGNSQNNLDWTKFYYNLYPRQRVAGQP